MQYSITNLNAFILLIAIGFSLYPFVNDGSLKNNYLNLLDRNNSPVQLISQIKGYYNLNPMLALSLAITLFSFVGIPPLIGFFAKQMVLSAALDGGYIFLALVAILTSVISAVYYLGIMKQVFFDQDEYKLNEDFEKITFSADTTLLLNNNSKFQQQKMITTFNIENIKLSTSLSVTISILTLTLLLFMFSCEEWLNMASILALIMFNL